MEMVSDGEFASSQQGLQILGVCRRLIQPRCLHQQHKNPCDFLPVVCYRSLEPSNVLAHIVAAKAERNPEKKKKKYRLLCCVQHALSMQQINNPGHLNVQTQKKVPIFLSTYS